MPKPEEFAIYVRSKEEWDIVIKAIRPPEEYYDSFDNYSQTCICSSDGTYCSRDWFETHDYPVVTFDEWRETYYPKSGISKVQATFISVPKI